MDCTPPKWKTVNGQRCLVVQDVLSVTGNQKHFTESDKVQVIRILDSRNDFSWELLIKEAESVGIGRLRLHAIVEHLLTIGDLCEPALGYLALTGRARVGGAF